MIATVSLGAYWSVVAGAGASCMVLCIAAQRRPGRWRIVVIRTIGTALAADIVAYSIGLTVSGTWSPLTSLPLALCDAGALVAFAACGWQTPVLVELTYFWGLTGTLAAIITPDLNVGFPHLVFFEFIVGHLGIVFAGSFLVVGLHQIPRPKAVARVLGITAVYTACVGLIDAITGANYMFLQRPPGEWTLLRLLGPWPWYVLSAAAGCFVLLDMPFWSQRHRTPESWSGHSPMRRAP